MAGWCAVSLSTVASSFWALWGGIECFHEGWYYREWYRNVGLALVQYLPWMFVPMIGCLIALWRRWVGVAAHVLGAVAALVSFDGGRSAGALLIAAPLAGLAVLYAVGAWPSIRAARVVACAVPMIVLVVGAAPMAWRVTTRPATVDLSRRTIAGDGVALVWAPAGPGWPDHGAPWEVAKDACARLEPDGLALAPTPRHYWRLPTVDEVVRTLLFRGVNAGGTWDAASRRATFDHVPDKDAPLWNRYSPVTYWWTADADGEDRAFRVVYNGTVNSVRKNSGAAYLAWRCVAPAFQDAVGRVSRRLADGGLSRPRL